MIIIIPMAGSAKRFFDAGYNIPKYMIKIKEKTLFEYSLSSLPLDLASKIIFVGLSKHDENFNLKNFILNNTDKLNIKAEIEILLLDNTTRGQAETVLKAENYINPEEELMLYNIDTYFSSKNLKKLLLDKNSKKDGILSAFYLQQPDDKWSFAEIDEFHNVIRTTEKIPISNYPLTGMYHFSRAQDFLDTAKNYIDNDVRYKNEFYIAPMYNDLIQKGKNFVIDIADEFIPLGTPQDVEKLMNKNKVL